MNDFINNYDLFIFDLDDTLVQTEKYHYESWIKILQNNIGPDYFIDFHTFCSKFHSNKPDNIKTYLINELYLEDFETVIQQKNIYYFNLITKERENIKLLDGAIEILENIINNNKKFVIVSNSLKTNVDYFSELFPILKKSTKNYYREMFNNKKPNPECYLKVVNDFPNNKIVGFEDSITGIHAMTLVNNIDTIFINNPSYYYYNYIIDNYKLTLVINNYRYLQK
jgi:beta-phosphoglucomutase